MNEHDLLDAIGGIDPKFIESAERTVSKPKKIVRIQNYFFAAAGIFILVIAGVAIRNSQINTAVVETEEVTTGGVIGDDTEEVTTAGVIGDDTEEVTTAGGAAKGLDATEDSSVLTDGGSKKSETKSADMDFTATIMYEGTLYKDSGEAFNGEILEDKLLQVSSYTEEEPSENGQQNFDPSSETQFFVLDEESIVVLIDPDEGIRKIFMKQ
jgi:hypothetical protein